MNTERAIEVLEWWVETAKRASGGDGSVTPGTQAFLELQAREDQTRRVLAQVQDAQSLPDILDPSMYNDHYWVASGIRQAEYALGKLHTDAETKAILEGSAPTMKADELHHMVWGAAAKRWDAGNYADAVQRSATAISGMVKDRTGRYELGDNDLMKQAFALDAPQEGKPRLRWPGNGDDLTVRSMRVGILYLAQGVFSAIRNRATHTTDELPMQEALEELATLSVLARWIERCQLVSAFESGD